jgi:hypothetical protein
LIVVKYCAVNVLGNICISHKAWAGKLLDFHIVLESINFPFL